MREPGTLSPLRPFCVSAVTMSLPYFPGPLFLQIAQTQATCTHPCHASGYFLSLITLLARTENAGQFLVGNSWSGNRTTWRHLMGETRLAKGRRETCARALSQIVRIWILPPLGRALCVCVCVCVCARGCERVHACALMSEKRLKGCSRGAEGGRDGAPAHRSPVHTH